MPATKAQPKEMLPLVDKPLIQYVVEESVQAGVTNVIIVTGRGKSAIEDHFDVSFELERFLAEKGKEEELGLVRGISDLIRVAYVRQKEALSVISPTLNGGSTVKSLIEAALEDYPHHPALTVLL